MVLTEDIKSLFHIVRTMLGAPIRPVQLEDEQLCDLLNVAIGDYAEKVQNWIIETQWLNVQSKDRFQFQNANELAYAMTVRTFDWSRDYSYWYSREVGLQQRGNYELKKDFFKIEKGKQVYVIPAGREINKVMYITPSTTKAALYGNWGTLDTGIGGGFGQLANVGYMGGLTGFYVGNVYDTALFSADLKYKNSMLRGDLAYKVTAGPEGTHLVHLLSTPGSPNMVGGLAADDSWGWRRYNGCYCWYTYYDVSGASEEDIEQCRIENKDDVILTPDEVPFEKMRYELMNNPTQQIIRRLLVAEAKILLGIIRGTYSGTVKIPEAEMQMDYSMLLEQGKSEKESVLTELKERLERMLPWNLMKNQAELGNQLMEVLKKKPLGMYWR